MRNPMWLAAGALSLLALGCSGSGGQSPLAPAPAGPADSPAPSGSTSQSHGSVGLGGIAHNGNTAEQAMAIYRVQLDPATLTASITPKEVRSAQGNDDVTDLDISCFLGGGELSLDSVAKSAGNIDITYSFAHPFANTAPHTLGAPVRVVVMLDADVLAPVYFAGDGDIVANTAVVANANGYLDPGQLLDTTGFNANVFPYQVLVDETLDNRDVTNGADVLGNWDNVAGEGWQTGLPGTWTGLGWLHKGQTATRTLSLDAAALSGGVSFDLAFIAKYTKPNATGLNKSPSSPVDTLEFAYRGFHGALDLEDVQFVGESGGFLTNVASPSTLDFTVRDWDAQATETAEVDLQNEADASMVAIGESGEPTLELSIPDVLGATVYTLTESADSGTGIAGDELVYSETVIKGTAGTVVGDHVGLIRATDAEALSDTSLWHFAIDCATLGLVTGPGLSVYQDFTVNMAPDNAAPTVTAAMTSGDPMNSGTQPSLSISAINDLDGDALDIFIDWGDGNGFPGVADLTLAGPTYTPPYNFTRATLPTMNNADLTPDLINVVVRVTDSIATTDTPLSYTLGPNRAPEIGAGTATFASTTIATGASFSITGTSAAATDPEGDALDYIASSSIAPLGPFPNASGGPFPVSVGPYPTSGNPSITLYASDGLHNNLTPAQPDSATAYPAVACVVANDNWSNFSGSLSTASVTYWYGWDIASFPNTTYPGWVFETNTSALGGQPRQLQRITSLSPLTTSNLTNFVPGTVLTGMAHQIEILKTNRVFYAQRLANTVSDTAPPASIYSAASGGGANISWFDYAGAPVAALGGTINTGTNRVIALTSDDLGNIYYLDHNGIIHKLAAGTYIEQLVGGFPINLGALAVPAPILPAGTQISNAGVGDAHRCAHDFVYSEVDNAFFVLAQSRISGVAPGNGLLYRIEGNGTYNPVVAGNPNPARFVLNTSTTQGTTADIAIDRYSSAGALLGAVMSAQIITGSPNTNGAPNDQDLRRWNSSLVNTYSFTYQGVNTSLFRQLGLDPISGRLMGHTASFDFMGIMQTPPTGWQ